LRGIDRRALALRVHCPLCLVLGFGSGENGHDFFEFYKIFC
jgi:hypothetical protein